LIPAYIFCMKKLRAAVADPALHPAGNFICQAGIALPT